MEWSSCTGFFWSGAGRMPRPLALTPALSRRREREREACYPLPYSLSPWGRAGVRAGATRLLLLFLALFLSTAHATISVRDDRNLTVTFPTPPQRIVSLLPSLTEFVCALDACSRLVGVDDY